MTRYEILRMAREAGMEQEFHGLFPSMERFAALVAATCKSGLQVHDDTALLRQALDALEVYAEYDPEGGGVADNAIAALRERLECAAAIRARGQE